MDRPRKVGFSRSRGASAAIHLSPSADFLFPAGVPAGYSRSVSRFVRNACSFASGFYGYNPEALLRLNSLAIPRSFLSPFLESAFLESAREARRDRLHSPRHGAPRDVLFSSLPSLAFPPAPPGHRLERIPGRTLHYPPGGASPLVPAFCEAALGNFHKFPALFLIYHPPFSLIFPRRLRASA